MPNRRVIAINGSGGAFTSILATGMYHYCTLNEDGTQAAQGLDVQYPGDAFASTTRFPAGTTVTLRGPGRDGAIGMSVQGAPGNNNYRAADVMVKVRSATVTATTLDVEELEVGPQ